MVEIIANILFKYLYIQEQQTESKLSRKYENYRDLLLKIKY